MLGTSLSILSNILSSHWSSTQKGNYFFNYIVSLFFWKIFGHQHKKVIISLSVLLSFFPSDCLSVFVKNLWTSKTKKGFFWSAFHLSFHLLVCSFKLMIINTKMLIYFSLYHSLPFLLFLSFSLSALSLSLSLSFFQSLSLSHSLSSI